MGLTCLAIFSQVLAEVAEGCKAVLGFPPTGRLNLLAEVLHEQ